MLGQLRDCLFERIDGCPARSVLALLDPNHPVASTHPLHVDRLTKRSVTPELLVVPRDDRMSDPDSHPRLLVLRRPEDRGYRDEDLLALTLACAQQRRLSINGAYICGWLVTDAPPDEIALQIRRNIIVDDTSARRRRVVPLFEPHRLVLASHLASPQWLNRWLGAVSSWFLIDACGQLREMRPALHDAAQAIVSPGPDFWHAQSRIKQAREVLLAMVKAEQMVPVDCEIRIDFSLQAAYREGLSEVEDVIFFAANHMVLPARWHMHPAVRTCIASAVSGKAALTDSIASLRDDALEELSLVDPGQATQRNLRGSK